MRTPTQPSFHSGLCGKSWTDGSKNISLGALRSSTLCISRLRMKICPSKWDPTPSWGVWPPTDMQGVNWGIENSPQSGCEHAPDFLQAPSCSPFGTAACTLSMKQLYQSLRTKRKISHSLYQVAKVVKMWKQFSNSRRSCNTWSFCLCWFAAPHPGHKYFIGL